MASVGDERVVVHLLLFFFLLSDVSSQSVQQPVTTIDPADASVSSLMELSAEICFTRSFTIGCLPRLSGAGLKLPGCFIFILGLNT